MSEQRKSSTNLPAESTAGLSRDGKRALLARLLQERAHKRNLFPLSPAQRRLWTIWQLDPDNPVYNVPLGLRYKDKIDPGVLERCFNEIVRRHETLRTTFTIVDGQPMQVIAPAMKVVLPVIDLRNLPPDEREAEMLRLAQVEARRPFDLEKGPLFRFSLLLLAEADVAILLYMHHILSDGWSLGVLRHEIEVLYEAFCAGQPSPLPELPIQYVDYAAWQQKQLQGERLEALHAYWKKQLAGAPELLDLPADRPWPPVRTSNGAGYTFTISAGVTQALKELSRQANTTLFTTLLAAFSALLYRYTEQEDILIGTALTNRNRVELEGLIGFFTNMLVVRTRMDGNPRFSDLLEQVRQAVLEGYAHELPFEQLLDILDLERNPAHSPLFQAAFTLLEPILDEDDSADSLIQVDTGTAMFELLLHLTDKKQGLSGYFQYNTDLFDEATIQRLAWHLQTWLEGIVADPRQRIANLPLLPEPEQRRLLVEWNDTKVDYPQSQCIHELFEAQAEQMPDALALVCGEQSLTYRELNSRANQLARYLQKLGVGPETLVGICLERSPEMVVGLLGILKAGGAYVPLDPAYPEERLAFMLEDAQTPLLLTQERLKDRLPAGMVQQVYLDTCWRIIGQECSANLASHVTLDNLAYAIYTSGSTGTPKGVLVTQRSVYNLLQALQPLFAVQRHSRILQFASLSFDAAVTEILLAGVSGATLCMADRETLASGSELVALLRAQAITLVTWPPSLLAHLQPEGLEQLETVVSAGESCTREVVARWAPGRRFLNGYGPTEATVAACYHRVTPERLEGTSVPIGRPIANVRLYVLDPYLQPVPVGAPGELYIGGVGVARGYLNRPELTAERFIPNPFASLLPERKSDGGAWPSGEDLRLYKTGDRVRYRPDGTLEFLGRIDHQVKVRGFRIELGEIEAVLSQHPAVQAAVVAVRDEQRAPGERRLVAYVVPAGETAPSLPALRQFLMARLPEYMVPAAFVFLSELPLTPSGKVDRRALPAPDGARPELEEAFVAPRTRVEEQLATIWAQVLGVEQVGVHDNFFALGGDSILCIQVVSKVNEAGLRLTPKHLFQYPTISELAGVIETAPAVQAEQGPVTGEAPLTPIQHWFFEQNLAAAHHFNQAVTLTLQHPLQVSTLEQAIQAVARQHDALRSRFTRGAVGWQCAYVPPGDAIPIVEVDLAELAASEQQAACEQVAARLNASLDFSAGPLWRVAYFHLSPRVAQSSAERNSTGHTRAETALHLQTRQVALSSAPQNSTGHWQVDRLLIVIHHLVVDGVSWRILLEDLHAAYQQLSQGQEIALPAKTTSFKYWAERLAGYAQAEALREESYWLAESRTLPAPLPVDYAGGAEANDVASTDTISVSLSVGETHALLRQVPKAYNTQINDALLAALAQAFARWRNEPGLLVDLEGHGREPLFEDVDVSRTVGWFTSISPVYLDLNPGTDPGSALKMVKEQLRRIPHHGIGYGLLRYLHPDGAIRYKLATLPRAEVSFNYLGRIDQAASEGALFALALEPPGPIQGACNKRAHLLEVNSYLAGDQLTVKWIYSKAVHRRATVERLAQGFIQALQAVIAHCQSPDAGGHTPSDFGLARLDERKLAKLSRILDQIDAEGAEP